MNAKIGCLRINVKEWQRDAWNQAFNVCQSIIFRNAWALRALRDAFIKGFEAVG